MLVFALADGVASETATSLEQLLAMIRIPGLLMGKGVGQGGLPNVGRDSPNLRVVQAEIRHLGAGAEIGGLLKPDWDPVFIQLETRVF